MSAGKVSIFITVLALHASVLGIVYVVTRSGVDTVVPEKEAVAKEAKEGSTTKELEKKPTQEEVEKQRGYKIHVVTKRDYLGKIASKYNIPMKKIIDLNNLSNPNNIREGLELKIPLN